jgi:hypothetical protein
MPVTDDGVVIWPRSFLACSDRRENVGDVTGGLERTNGGAALEAGLGRGGDGWCCFRGSDEAVYGAVGRPVVQDPVLRPRANRRCFETPGRGLGWSRMMGWSIDISYWRPNKKGFSPFSLCRLFSLTGEAGWFGILIWVPLIVVPDTNETHFFSLFLKPLLHHKKRLCGSSLNTNETLTETDFSTLMRFSCVHGWCD